MKKKSKINKLSAYVIFSIALLVIYTVVTMLVTILRPNYINDTLTTCFFATFGGEILSCALIKIFKLKEEKENDQ